MRPVHFLPVRVLLCLLILVAAAGCRSREERLQADADRCSDLYGRGGECISVQLCLLQRGWDSTTALNAALDDAVIRRGATRPPPSKPSAPAPR